MKLGALDSLAAETQGSARMVIINAETDRPLVDEEGKECFIDFLSIDSEIGRKLARARSIAAVRKIRSGRNRPDDEDFIEEQVETLSALATNWYFGREADAFSQQAARALFADPNFGWLRRQAFAFVNAEANFMRRSPKS